MLEFLEARPGTDQMLDAPLTETVAAPVPALRQPADRAKRRRERLERFTRCFSRKKASARAHSVQASDASVFRGIELQGRQGLV